MQNASNTERFVLRCVIFWLSSRYCVLIRSLNSNGCLCYFFYPRPTSQTKGQHCVHLKSSKRILSGQNNWHVVTSALTSDPQEGLQHPNDPTWIEISNWHGQWFQKPLNGLPPQLSHRGRHTGSVHLHVCFWHVRPPHSQKMQRQLQLKLGSPCSNKLEGGATGYTT